MKTYPLLYKEGFCFFLLTYPLTRFFVPNLTLKGEFYIIIRYAQTFYISKLEDEQDH